jgi:HAD superfamily hydrolase (TIGR01509 family)
MNRTAAIFDIDGTLIDSVDLHAEAWREAFAHFGHDIAFHEVRTQIGKGGDQLMPVFLPPDELHAKKDKIEKFRGELFRREFLPQVKAFPMVRELFQRLLADGWKLSLASSAKESELKIYKEIADITDLLEAETSSDDAEKSKPYPDIFLAAMERLGNVQPDDCIVIGDSPYDAQAACKAGIRSIGFLCGGFSDAELKDAGYERVYQGPADLLASYESSLFKQRA